MSDQVDYWTGCINTVEGKIEKFEALMQRHRIRLELKAKEYTRIAIKKREKYLSDVNAVLSWLYEVRVVFNIIKNYTIKIEPEKLEEEFDFLVGDYLQMGKSPRLHLQKNTLTDCVDVEKKVIRVLGELKKQLLR